MTANETALPAYAYATGWNEMTYRPVLGEVWLTEDQAREQFEAAPSYFQVLDPIALNGEAPSFILEIRSAATGRLASHRYNSAGSIMVKADLRPENGRYFLDQVRSWTYPDAETRYSMSGSTSITTVTFEPDGTGTFTLKDKLEPANSMRMEARDIPVEDNWVDRFGFGEWDVLRNLKALEPTTPLVPPR
jgi:hypothetical protein